MENINKELLKLIEANPDLPVVPLVDCEVADEYGYAVGAFAAPSIDEYVFVEDDYDDEKLYLKSEQDELEEYFIEKLLTENGELTDDEAAEVAHKRAEALTWTKAIIVYIVRSEAE